VGLYLLNRNCQAHGETYHGFLIIESPPPRAKIIYTKCWKAQDSPTLFLLCLDSLLTADCFL
jgi:hypothetical protein